MLNVPTKYSTMVTDGSTGSTSYVPMMPRAKGFLHHNTQADTKSREAALLAGVLTRQ